jgi:polyisoprenoid-binding protein YceI
MLTHYRFVPQHSRFTVQAFTTGLLSFLGHSPTFAVRDFTGAITFEDDLISTMRAELTVGAKSLDILNKLKPNDREELERRMWGDVLGVGEHPEIIFRTETAATERVGNGQYRVALDGGLSLRGVVRRYPINGELAVFKDGVRLKGSTRLRMSDFSIRPITALGGTIQLKDELILSFDLAASRESA